MSKKENGIITPVMVGFPEYPRLYFPCVVPDCFIVPGTEVEAEEVKDEQKTSG